MTPAERLLAAADLLDKRAGDDLTPGPWTVQYECPEGEHHHDWDEVWIAGDNRSTVAGFNERYTCAPRDASYVALMQPTVGKALAVVLRTEGARISGTAALAVAFDGSPLHPARADLLALADLLLAGAA